MALWNNENNEDLANQSKSGGAGSKTIIEGAYHIKPVSMGPTKSQNGEDKWEIKWELIAGETPEQTTESVGASRTEHFVVGHKKAEVAKSYQADFLLRLKLMGIDISQLNDDGDLFMAAKKIEEEQPVMCYFLKPQENNPKYLNWYPKGKVSADLSSVIGKDGIELSKWGLAEGGEAPAAVTSEAQPASDDLGL